MDPDKAGDVPLDIRHDEQTDIVMICGMRYSGHLFRVLALAEPGKWLRIESRRDGVLTVYNVSDEIERSFDAICGRSVQARPT